MADNYTTTLALVREGRYEAAAIAAKASVHIAEQLAMDAQISGDPEFRRKALETLNRISDVEPKQQSTPFMPANFTIVLGGVQTPPACVVEEVPSPALPAATDEAAAHPPASLLDTTLPDVEDAVFVPPDVSLVDMLDDE